MNACSTNFHCSNVRFVCLFACLFVCLRKYVWCSSFAYFFTILSNVQWCDSIAIVAMCHAFGLNKNFLVLFLVYIVSFSKCFTFWVISSRMFACFFLHLYNIHIYTYIMLYNLCFICWNVCFVFRILCVFSRMCMC